MSRRIKRSIKYKLLHAKTGSINLSQSNKADIESACNMLVHRNYNLLNDIPSLQNDDDLYEMALSTYQDAEFVKYLRTADKEYARLKAQYKETIRDDSRRSHLDKMLFVMGATRETEILIHLGRKDNKNIALKMKVIWAGRNRVIPSNSYCNVLEHTPSLLLPDNPWYDKILPIAKEYFILDAKIKLASEVIKKVVWESNTTGQIAATLPEILQFPYPDAKDAVTNMKRGARPSAWWKGKVSPLSEWYNRIQLTKELLTHGALLKAAVKPRLNERISWSVINDA